MVACKIFKNVYFAKKINHAFSYVRLQIRLVKMKKRMVVTAMTQVMALGFCGSAAWAEAGAIPVGNMLLVPSVTLSESHNDNIFMQEAKNAIRKSWITEINPSFVLNAEDGAKQYELGYSLSSKTFQQSHADDVVNHFINFNADLGLSRKLTVDFNIDYNLTHDPRGSTFTGGVAGPVAEPDAYHETIVGGSVDYGSNAHMIVSGEYTNKRYTNNRARTITRDMDTAKVGAEFDYDITGKTAAVLEARYKKLDYKDVASLLDGNEQNYYIGLNWDATAKTTGRVRVGYVKKNFIKAANTGLGFFGWEASVEWLPMSYSSWTLNTSLLPVETDGTGSFIKNTEADISWNHAWSERLSHSASVGYTRGLYQASTRVDNTTTASASVNYQWLRWLAIQPTYDYTKRSSNAANSSYTANVWMLSLVGTL